MSSRNPSFPLNGTQTHPLSEHALDVLAECAHPYPVQHVNPGVRDRFARAEPAVVEIIKHPSPFKKHKGSPVDHYLITEAGRAILAARKAKP